MQTFITDFDMVQNAKNLDSKRLGEQRVEAIQIASCLLLKETKWKNHPAVKMWQGFEYYLIENYLLPVLVEWQNRGFSNEKCNQHYEKLYEVIKERTNKDAPTWITTDFIEAHRSNLIKKDCLYYGKIWSNIPNNLPYIWPKK